MILRWLSIFIFILILTTLSYAQNLDSLKQVYAELPDGKERVKLAEQLGDRLKGEEAVPFLRVCMAQAPEFELYLEATRCSLDYAYILLQNSKYDSLAAMCDEVIANFSQYQDSFAYARAWKLKGLSAQYQGNYNRSIELFLKVSEIYRSIDPRIYAENQMDIGLVYVRMEAFSKAKPFIWEAIVKTKSEPLSRRAYANSLNCYSAIVGSEGKADSAQYYLRQSAAIQQELGNESGQIIAYINLGQGFLVEPANYDSASFYVDSAIVMARRIGDRRNLSALYTVKGLVLAGQEQGQAAADMYLKATRLSDSLNYLPVYQIAVYNRANVLSQQTTQYKLAAELFQEYADLRDSLFTKEQMAAIEEVNAKYETAENARKLAAADAKLAQRNTWIIGLVAAVGIALLVAALLALQARSRQRKLRIAAQTQEIKAVIDATEKERRRIARELHDGVGQELNSLLMSVGNLSREASPELEARLRHATEEVRSISHQMMPRSLEIAGLVPALENLVETSFAHQNIEAQFDAFRVPAQIDPQVDLVMYRVAQELLNNVIRHAGASRVDMVLSGSNQLLRMIVEDNGKGRPENFNAEGLGLSNIKTRLSTVGGKLTYEPGEPIGVRAIVTIPLAS